jgi:hypothetical protein
MECVPQSVYVVIGSEVRALPDVHTIFVYICVQGVKAVDERYDNRVKSRILLRHVQPTACEGGLPSRRFEECGPLVRIGSAGGLKQLSYLAGLLHTCPQLSQKDADKGAAVRSHPDNHREVETTSSEERHIDQREV